MGMRLQIPLPPPQKKKDKENLYIARKFNTKNRRNSKIIPKKKYFQIQKTNKLCSTIQKSITAKKQSAGDKFRVIGTRNICCIHLEGGGTMALCTSAAKIKWQSLISKTNLSCHVIKITPTIQNTMVRSYKLSNSQTILVFVC